MFCSIYFSKSDQSLHLAICALITQINTSTECMWDGNSKIFYYTTDTLLDAAPGQSILWNYFSPSSNSAPTLPTRAQTAALKFPNICRTASTSGSKCKKKVTPQITAIDKLPGWIMSGLLFFSKDYELCTLLVSLELIPFGYRPPRLRISAVKNLSTNREHRGWFSLFFQTPNKTECVDTGKYCLFEY